MKEPTREIRTAVSDEHVFRPLVWLSWGLAVVFAAGLGVNFLGGVPQHAVLPMAVSDALVVVLCVCLGLVLSRQLIPAEWANGVVVAIAALATANVMVSFRLVGDPFYLSVMSSIVIGCGAFLLSIPWFIAALVGCNLAWLVAATWMLTGESLIHHGFSMWGATVIAVVIFVARRRAMDRIETVLREVRQEAEQRRYAEQTVAKTEEHLSLAVSASEGGWWILEFDPEHPDEIPDKMRFDPVIKGFIGFADGEFPDSRAAWNERILPEDQPMTRAVARAHLEGKSPLLDVWYRMRHKDGSTRWIHSCGRLERDDEGRPVNASGIAWDVTDLVETEERLRKLSRAVEESSSLILITDVDGKIEYVNPKFTRTTGYTLEEVTGKTPDMILRSSRTSDEFLDEMWKTILSGEEWQGELQNLKKNGEPYWVISSISPIKDSEGKITHFVGVQEDITERRRVETQLVHAQKMEGIGQLVSGVAHDFNNLLTGIVGFADLSLESIEKDHPLRMNLEQISKAGDSAVALTRQLLMFSREQRLPPQIVDLNEVIRGFEELLRRTIGEDVNLLTSLAPGAKLVKVDPSQIEQILVNLAVNARDAMPDGGRLTIETTDVDWGRSPLSRELRLAPGRYVVLQVTDTGHGMDEATSRRVFEPFFTTKERDRGTGLGLSTVYGIVRQSGGHIEIDSAPGNGTTFRIHLPLSETAAPAAAVSTDETGAERAAGNSILLVEDDALVRAFVVKLLRQNGYEVTEAEDARDAIDKCSDLDVDLLITDVIMPGMNGVELARKLGSERPEMKVLFLSGYADHEIVETQILKSDASFLAKPFVVEEFEKIVGALLNR